MKRIIVLMIFTVSACSTMPQQCLPDPKKDVVYVIGQGWHTEIGIPVKQLDKNLQFYAKVFPGAEVILFGYGKKTFVTAPPNTLGEYFIGPVPGPAVIHVVGLSVAPTKAYPPEDTFSLATSAEGSKALSEFIWNDLSKDKKGRPYSVAKSQKPDGLFYAAESEYNLLHTCNTWATDALHAAKLPITGDGVIFSGQSMGRVEAAASKQCLLSNGN